MSPIVALALLETALLVAEVAATVRHAHSTKSLAVARCPSVPLMVTMSITYGMTTVHFAVVLTAKVLEILVVGRPFVLVNRLLEANVSAMVANYHSGQDHIRVAFFSANKCEDPETTLTKRK